MSIYLILSSLVFIIGSFGTFLLRSHIIIILISFELLLLSASINFVIFSIFLDDLFGQIIAILILTIAAAESAIGLAILVTYYRLRGGISIDLINLLKA
jgi:NADH-quinone oxidoreductase subunit K